MRALVLLVLVACADTKLAAGYVGGSVAEYTACPLGVIDCGHVFLCEAEADNALGHVEICVNDDKAGDLAAAEAMYGMCEPTPRHQGLCKYCCGPDCGRGANAYNGAFCQPD